MSRTPHKDKLLAAIENPKASGDIDFLKEAFAAYETWIHKLNGLTSTGDARIKDMTALLNEYKNVLEIDLIASKGSDFIKRQKGQLKLDSSVLEEFLIHLINPAVLSNLPSLNKAALLPNIMHWLSI